MKSLSQFILEAKKPTVNDLGSKCQTYAYNYMKQWALGGFEKKDDCEDIKQITDEELERICDEVQSWFGPKQDLKKTCFTLGEEWEKVIRDKVTKENIDRIYSELEKTFTKRRIQIIIYGFSLSRSSKIDVIAECYRQLFTWCYTKDQERIEKIWKEAEENLG